MPEDVENCKESVLEDNPDYSESRAYAICWAQKNKGGLSVAEDATHDELLQAMAEGGPCEEGYVMVGTKQQDGQEVPNCVPIEETGELEPPSIANSRIMAQGQMDLEPIEREELSDGKVAYRNIKLLEAGVWTDQNSQTPTLYDEETFKNLEAKYDGDDGPAVNIAHDVDSSGEVNDASLSGYVDPDSLRANNDSLFGDIILNTSEPAGDFADENLKSALESKGEVGFSPSVEIDPAGEMELATDHPRAEHHATGGYLTGLGLVSNPASKPVDFAQQTRERAVAMSSHKDKDVYLKHDSMERELQDIEEVRETLDRFGIDADEMTDEEVQGMAEDLMSELDEYLAEGEPEDEEEEEDEEKEMQDDEEKEEEDEEGDNPMMEEEMNALRERVDELQEELATLREQMVDDEMMEETKEELAAAETVEEIETRLSELESEPEESKTLAEGTDIKDEWAEWSNAEGRVTEHSNSL